jgi:membrane-bound serine protease (ClpP class)
LRPHVWAIELSKVTNDAAAYIRSLAQTWGRNADWAEQAVRNSVSISAEEAVRIDVVDTVQPSTNALLSWADGRSIRLTNGSTVTLRTADAEVSTESMGWLQSLLHGLISPDLTFLFFFGGLALIVVELLHPGLSVPGLLGLIFMVIAFISFGFLPVELGGVILLIASAVFYLLELKHPGVGLPMVAGTVCLVLGGLLLFKPSVPNARVSPWLIVVVAAALVAFFLVVVRAVLTARHRPIASGAEHLVGAEGVATSDLDPRGSVRVDRETWSAESASGPVAAGAPVRVLRVVGVHLVVEPSAGGAAATGGATATATDTSALEKGTR